MWMVSLVSQSAVALLAILELLRVAECVGKSMATSFFGCYSRCGERSTLIAVGPKLV